MPVENEQSDMRLLNVSPYDARKCPECGSRDYEKAQTGQRIIKRTKGKSEKRFRWTDAGYFKCLKCGYYETY